jgi:hypothetical protein
MYIPKYTIGAILLVYSQINKNAMILVIDLYEGLY